MQYRAEIDGLRAIAVTSVILFHFDVPGIPGGFLGVDAFFVISGYLITRILVGEIEAGKLSLMEFYRRRTIRILPALLVMLLLVCAIGVPLLFPVDTRTLGFSAASASAYVANIFFQQQQSGYFDASDIKPLVHTWSLAVEEQFYIFYPVVLLALHRFVGRQLRPALWLMTLAGLGFYWFIGRNHPGAAFYLAPTRAWELLIGGLAAGGGFPALTDRRGRGALALLGLVLLVAAMLVPPGPEPALRGMIMACVGAALLLVYGTEGIAAKLLSLAPMRWIGKISYSLYLWHLPLREIYRSGIDPAPSWLVSLALFAVSLVMAILSYHFVEQPIRTRFRKGYPAGRIVAIGILASVVTAAIAIFIALNAAWLRPLPADVSRVAAYSAYKDGPVFAFQHVREDCRVGGREFVLDRCVEFSDTRPNIIVFGDSHAGHIWRAIAERFPQDNVVVASSNGCRPLFDTGGRNFCAAMVEQIRRDVIAGGKVDAVVLAANWREREMDDLEPTIAEIRKHGVRVTVLGPVMRYPYDQPQLLAQAMLRGRALEIPELQRSRIDKFDADMRLRAERAGATYYSLYDAECPQDVCRTTTRKGDPMHFDKAHLTLDASRELVEAMQRP